MTVKIIFDGATQHHCHLPAPTDYANGTIVECMDCGRQWRVTGNTNTLDRLNVLPGRWNLISGPTRTPTNGQEPPQ